MSICGYHPFMGEGLRWFSQGLTAALSEKARKNGRELRAQLEHELDEITILLHFLEEPLRSKHEGERTAARGFLGVVYVAQYLMAELQDIDSLQEDLPGFIKKGAEGLVELLQTFENKFEDSSSSSIVLRAQESWKAARAPYLMGWVSD